MSSTETHQQKVRKISGDCDNSFIFSSVSLADVLIEASKKKKRVGGKNKYLG
jgi:hypothetical protein